MTHIALTGGEPLLIPEESLEFFRQARLRWPNCHLRLYTSGDLLTPNLLDQLVDAGLDEIRFSVKMDDGEAYLAQQLDRIRMACTRDLDVMVEMPAIPGTEAAMRQLLIELDQAGAMGINLLEFCYPLTDWTPFAQRGFAVANPPFPILYDYAYSGGLPVEGSEVLCLKLVEYALDQGLGINVHYCSLENKHRDQIITLNRPAIARAKSAAAGTAASSHATSSTATVPSTAASAPANTLGPEYEMDPEDFFIRTIKLWIPNPQRRQGATLSLQLAGLSPTQDDDHCLLIPPSQQRLARDVAKDFQGQLALASYVAQWHSETSNQAHDEPSKNGEAPNSKPWFDLREVDLQLI